MFGSLEVVGGMLVTRIARAHRNRELPFRDTMDGTITFTQIYTTIKLRPATSTRLRTKVPTALLVAFCPLLKAISRLSTRRKNYANKITP